MDQQIGNRQAIISHSKEKFGASSVLPSQNRLNGMVRLAIVILVLIDGEVSSAKITDG